MAGAGAGAGGGSLPVIYVTDSKVVWPKRTIRIAGLQHTKSLVLNYLESCKTNVTRVLSSKHVGFGTLHASDQNIFLPINI